MRHTVLFRVTRFSAASSGLLALRVRWRSFQASPVCAAVVLAHCAAIVRGVVVTAGRGRLLARMLRVCWPLRTRWWPRVPSALPAAGSESNRQLVQDWADRWRLRGDRATVKYQLSHSRRRPRILLPRSSWLRFRGRPVAYRPVGSGGSLVPELSWFRRARRGHRRAIPPLSRRGLETSAEPLFRSAPVPKYCPTTHSHWCPKRQ